MANTGTPPSVYDSQSPAPKPKPTQPSKPGKPTRPAPRTGAATTHAKPKTSTSTPSLYDQALAQAKAALAGEKAPILDQQAASDAYYRQRQTDAQGNAAALAKLLGNVGPQIQQTYDTAAQNQSLLGKGFSDGMQAALTGNTDNLNAILKQVGSPQQLDSHAAEAGDVLQGLGGYIPGSAMTREGAAFGAAAQMLPATALREGAENVKQLGIKSDQAHAEFDAKIAELAGKLPGDAQKNYQELQKLALENKKFALDVRKNRFNQAYKTAQFNQRQGEITFNQNMSVQKFRLDQQYKGAQLQIQYNKLNIDSAKFARQQYQQDREYQMSMARLGISQKSLQLRAAAQEFKFQNGGFTPSQINKFKATLQSHANAIQMRRAPDGSMHWYIAKDSAEFQKGGEFTHEIRYADFVKQAVAGGVPIAMAIDRANKIFPEADRPTPKELAGVTGISQKAAAQGTGWQAQTGAYNQTVGLSPATYGANPGRVAGLPFQGNLVGVNVSFVKALAAAARAAGATAIQITSGRRSAGDNARVGGVSNSNHLTGNAVDGRVLIKGRWVPLGDIPNLAHFGIRSGDQAGFFNGERDPYHVDDGANSGGNFAGGTNGLKQYAYTKLGGYGWGVQDMQALDQLWTRESGWNPNARNPKSGAAGIPQALGHKLPPGYAVDPQAQIDWGLNYIRGRYGSPRAAWVHEQRFGWY